MPKNARGRAASVRPCLRVSFGSAREFRRAYENCLARGEIEVETTENVRPRKVVDVELELTFCGESILFQGAVVSGARSGRGENSRPAKVTVQLLEPGEALHARFKRYLRSSLRDSQAYLQNRRVHPRLDARVDVELDVGSAKFAASLRNASRSGILAFVDGPQSPVGTVLRMTFTHPRTGQKLEIGGTVVRFAPDEQNESLIGIHFEPAAGRDVGDFMEDLQAYEHARRIASITGPVGAMGLENLLQMLCAASSAGTLRVMRGYEEGRIAFAQGRLRYAQVGLVAGAKALARMLTWLDGTFEVVPDTAPAQPDDDTYPVDGALLEAMHHLDQLRCVDATRFPPGVTFALDREALEAERDSLAKVEGEVAALAAGGEPVQGILDAVSASDAAILIALGSLVEKGVLSIAT